MCDVKVVTDLATIIESIINLSSGTFVTFFEVLFMFVCLLFFFNAAFHFCLWVGSTFSLIQAGGGWRGIKCYGQWGWDDNYDVKNGSHRLFLSTYEKIKYFDTSHLQA